MVRFATDEDLCRVNELRKQVNDVHVKGRPDIFRGGFGQEMQELIFDIHDDAESAIIVAEKDGKVRGFACVSFCHRPESVFMNARDFYDVEEFDVDERFRRQGIGRELFAFMQKDAKARGFKRIELNMWEFNEGALAFYKALGFKTYRRFMELEL